MTSNAIFEMDFDIELKWGLIQTTWKDSNKFLKDWKEILSHEMTKMPLGAKLTKKNDSTDIFEMNFDMRLKQGLIQTNLKDSNKFQGLKWIECRKWLKYPSM